MTSVTTAAPSAEAERTHRMKVYLLQMGLRIIAFPIGTWLIIAKISVPIGIGLLVFAAVIPYIAVVKANARTVEPGDGLQPVSPHREALTAAPVEEQQEPRRPRDRDEGVIVGDLVDD